jgi:hypothetical protein
MLFWRAPELQIIATPRGSFRRIKFPLETNFTEVTSAPARRNRGLVMAKPFGRHPTTPLRVLWAIFLCGILFVCSLSASPAQTQPSSPQAPQPVAPQDAQKADAKVPNDEIVSRDSPAPFKVRVNLVLVRVVVRDNNGKVVTNLKQDFQLADNRKLQIISSFSMETPASHVPTVKMDSPEPTSRGTPVKAPELPQRFVTLFFDDLHLSTQDALLSRP